MNIPGLKEIFDARLEPKTKALPDEQQDYLYVAMLLRDLEVTLSEGLWIEVRAIETILRWLLTEQEQAILFAKKPPNNGKGKAD